MYAVPKEKFISYFEEKILKPRNLDYKIAFPGPTGTNAIELALKLARKVKKDHTFGHLQEHFME